MNIQNQARSKPDDTRARIIETADGLFRRLGFAKTTVADIAGELGMSPANVYRFFASKNAIVEAICHRHLGTIENAAWSIARSQAPAAARLERLFLEILGYYTSHLLGDERVMEIVMAAIEHSWDAVRAHKDVMRTVLELILRDGIDAGEFEPVDPRGSAEAIMRSMTCFCHPVLVAESISEGQDLEAEARNSVRFLLRAITPRA
ncbi:MAG TPA: TetR/AcrR family transcriptional regulator [Xanthobacteraceae bacterium]|nr:TetR/AcrR family transcriptional regulator [Xanthobacteraceae bacterium]